MGLAAVVDAAAPAGVAAMAVQVQMALREAEAVSVGSAGLELVDPAASRKEEGLASTVG